MNKLLIEFMRENELSDELLWKKAAEKQMMFVRDQIGSHLTHSPIFVISTHTSKSCLLPVYAFKLTNGIEFIMRENFYGWVVSIRSPFTIEKLPDFCKGDYLCKGNYNADIAACYCEGFHRSWVYKYKNEDFCYTTFRVHEDYDLYVLIYMLNKLEGKHVVDETDSEEVLSICVKQIGENHPSCDSIYDIFRHSYFATTNYDFCEKNDCKAYYESRFNEEGINEFANRLSKFKDIRLMFFDELGKIQWGEGFK